LGLRLGRRSAPAARDRAERLDCYHQIVQAEQEAQCALAPDIFGSPFRPPPSVDPAVLAWHGGARPRLAEAIHESRRFEDLPVLADLLEEAGLTDAGLLGHLRGPGPGRVSPSRENRP
jgi:hypothetical protein